MRALSKCLAAPIALGIASLSLAACSDGAGEAGTTSEVREDSTIAEIVTDTANLTTVASALSDTGLDSVFDGPGSYTILAPSDATFEALDESAAGLIEEAQRPILVAVLRNHIIPGHLTAESIEQALEDSGGIVAMRTLGGGTVSFERDEDAIAIVGPEDARARISGQAIAASNGVVVPVEGLLGAAPLQ